MDLLPLLLTLKLALVTTLLLFVISVPLAYWLNYSRSRVIPFFEAIISMPIILPPTVLGFYLLIAFSPSSIFGGWIDEYFGLQLVFSFEGLVFASCIYSLPFMVHPIQTGFSKINPTLLEASYVLGKSRVITLFKVLLPNMKSSILTGIILSFAHTIGEFGVVLMIGGSIPGETKVASIAIYEEVEALNYSVANRYSLTLVSIAFITLILVFLFNKGFLKYDHK